MSVFWHNNELGEAQEWRVIFKTSTATRSNLATRIQELHPWSGEAEILATPVEWATDYYTAWVEKVTAAVE